MTQLRGQQRLHGWLSDVFIIIMVMTAGWMVSDRLDKWLDLHLDDETFYLGRGANFPAEKLQDASWGPLYSLWYWSVAHLFSVKTLKLYLLNQRLLIMLVPACLFAAMRSFKVGRITALVMAWVFAISDLNVATDPKVGHFAAIVILTTLAVSNLVRTRGSLRWSVLMLGFLAAAYVRPEFFLSFCLAAAVLVFTELRARKLMNLPWRTLWLPSAALVVAASFLFAKGVPVGSRSFAAFSQHFSLNWTTRHADARLDGWTDDDLIISRTFGPVHSLSAACMANPGAVVFHVVQNAGILVPEILRSTLAHRSVLTASGKWWHWLESIVALGGVAIFSLLRNYKVLPLRVRANFAGMWNVLPPVVAALSATLVIHPDSHYLVTLSVCSMIVLAGLTAPRPEDEHTENHPLPVIALAAALALISPPYLDKARPLPGYTTLHYLKSFRTKDDVRLLSTATQIHTLLGHNWHSVSSWNKQRDEGFMAFLKRTQLDFIVADQRLDESSRYRDDAEWKSFRNTPASVGFKEYDISGDESGIRIFYRKELESALKNFKPSQASNH